MCQFHFTDMNYSLDVQLNLKNDTLRRRYDGLKYDIKKIEEGIREAFSLTFDFLIRSQSFTMFRFVNLLLLFKQLRLLPSEPFQILKTCTCKTIMYFDYG